jgi:hypothetical protein
MCPATLTRASGISAREAMDAYLAISRTAPLYPDPWSYEVDEEAAWDRLTAACAVARVDTRPAPRRPWWVSG